jgi:hypothetical protein
VTKIGRCGKILTRKELASFSMSWDASTSYGTSGFFTFYQDYFSIPWRHIIRDKKKNKQPYEDKVCSE